jgi:hypothetical protein
MTRRAIPPDEVPELVERAKVILERALSTRDPDELVKIVDLAHMLDAVKQELQSPCPSATRLRDIVEQTLVGIALDDRGDDGGGAK